MPLTAEAQRKRRAMLKPEKKDEKLPRKRCKNDGKLFEVTRPNKDFCCDNCRREFSRHGSAFGPLKATLEKLVKRWMRDYQTEIQAQIMELRKRVDALEESHVPTSRE